MPAIDQIVFRFSTPVELKSVLNLIDLFDRPKAPRPSQKHLEQTLAQIEQAGGGVIVGISEDKIISTCTLNLCANLSWSARPYAIIENVMVHPDCRKQGIGKAMLHFAAAQAKAKDCYKVALMTGSKRESTLAFYQTAGFEPSKAGFQIRFNA